MTKTTETKHQRFLRLMNRRLGRALGELRLISQLSSANYENTPEEAEEVVVHLDQSLNQIAKIFGIPYSTAIGAAAYRAVQSGHLTTSAKASKIDEVDIAKAIAFIKQGKSEDATVLLKAALLQETR